MNSRFLEALSLQTLLAPATEEDFHAHCWEKEPLVVHRNDPNYYGDLFTLEDFDHAMATDPPSLRTADAKSKRASTYEGSTATPALEDILAEMQNGTTLILNRLNRREPKLGLLCRILSQELGHVFSTNLYLTPSNGQGFTPHYDNHDVFILQVLGFKHWKIEKKRRKWPDRGVNRMDDKEGREIQGEAHSFTLNQGDVIYIPRGFVHAAECGSEPSLHITLGLHPFTWSDLLQAIFMAALRNDEQLTHALLTGFLRGNGDDLVRGAMAALNKISDEANLSAIVDQFKDEVVTKSSPDILGQVAGFFHSSQLKSEDRVGPRPGIVYRLHPGEESLRLTFGRRHIQLPAFLKDSLDFALNTADYAIRDIVGDLEDSEKIVFVERLMREGMIIRK